MRRGEDIALASHRTNRPKKPRGDERASFATPCTGLTQSERRTKDTLPFASVKISPLFSGFQGT